MAKKRIIEVKGVKITITQKSSEDFISLTDIASGFEGTNALIEKWIRNKNTIEFLAVWEQLYNPDFNLSGLEDIYKDVGTNRFVMSVKKWVTKTNSIGIIASAGRYGGTYAHREIAFEFATWINPFFKIKAIQKNISNLTKIEDLFDYLFDKSVLVIENVKYSVYLMFDMVTKLYKVGVAKKPIYREKTLQSEKPVIVLIDSIEFPQKDLAYQFENETHTKYDRIRVRGEWFNFSSTDLQDISLSFELKRKEFEA